MPHRPSSSDIDVSLKVVDEWCPWLSLHFFHHVVCFYAGRTRYTHSQSCNVPSYSKWEGFSEPPLPCHRPNQVEDIQFTNEVAGAAAMLDCLCSLGHICEGCTGTFTPDAATSTTPSDCNGTASASNVSKTSQLRRLMSTYTLISFLVLCRTVPMITTGSTSMLNIIKHLLHPQEVLVTLRALCSMVVYFSHSLT